VISNVAYTPAPALAQETGFPSKPSNVIVVDEGDTFKDKPFVMVALAHHTEPAAYTDALDVKGKPVTLIAPAAPVLFTSLKKQ
jgi:hypothetical protein